MRSYTTGLHSHDRMRQMASCLLLACLFSLSACSTDGAPEAKQDKKTPKRAQLVETAKAEMKKLSSTTTRTGTLQVLREVRIFNQEEGRINEIRHFPGDTFTENDVLIRLDDKLLRAQLDKATATRLQTEQDLRRLESLVKKRLAAEDELARAKTALTVARAEETLLKTRLEYTVIRAPFNGVVSQRLLEPGDIAPRHTHIMTILDPASLITHVEVSELLISNLKIGDTVSIQIDALPRQVFSGTIRRIYPTVNPTTRQGTLEISLDHIPVAAKAGQFCRVILNPPKDDHLVIPFTALRRDEKGEFVYTVDTENKARLKYVRTGIRDGYQVSVLEGLETGTSVVTKGFLGLSDGKPVKLVNTEARATPVIP